MPVTHATTLEFRLWYGTALFASAASTLFLVTTLRSLGLLWRARARATTFGRRAPLPYTCVLLGLGLAVAALELQGMLTALATTASGSAFDQLLRGGRCDASGVAINVLYHVAILVNDALLVFRAFVIMQKRLLHALFPAVLFLASSVLATVADVECAYTLGHPSSAEIRITTMAWLVVNVLLNIMLTTLIVVTLWPARRHGDKRVTSVVGILAESAAGYTVAGVLFIGAVGAGSPFQILFERVFGATAFLSSSIITFRIATGIEYVPPGASPLLPTTGAHWPSTIAEDITKTR